MNLLDHGRDKFPVASVVASSAALGWKGIAAEIRAHPACELPPFRSTQAEVTIALRGALGGFVHRSAGGLRQQTAVGAGTIWISPGGVEEEATRISAPLSDVLHIYLSADPLTVIGAEHGIDVGNRHVNYEADARDELLRHMGLAIAAELRAPTAGGKVLAESLALSMAARIVQSHSSIGPRSELRRTPAARGMGCARIQRVVDFMVAHLEEPIGLNDLAAVACLSPFHFARTFRNEIGVPPHRFLTALRLDHAKTLLKSGNRPLSDIALACQFSSQTNFTRAFRQSTGVTPSRFREST
jgi:AraC family transcriptional regulator